MGSAGTDVAREASQLVLLDDDFSTIAAAVEEGRRVFDNITKFITWTLPTNLAEGLVILVAILLGISLPITPLQILWINMVTAVALGLMLAFEPAEPGLMERAPRPPRQPILTRPLIARIGLVSFLLVAGAFGLFAAMLENGSTLAEARTVAVNTFVAGEIAYVFNCRSLTGSSFRLGIFSNPLIWVGVSVTIAIQMVFTYFPPMQFAFDTEPIGAVEWLLIVAAGALVGLIVAIEKAIRARIGRLAADPG